MQRIRRKMLINQGDIYWVRLPVPEGEAPSIPHPYVIIQEYTLHYSLLNRVVACSLTSKLKRISLPGNVLLDRGEANLLKPSVVEVSKTLTCDKAHLGEYIGTVSDRRIAQILAGIRFVQRLLPP